MLEPELEPDAAAVAVSTLVPNGKLSVPDPGELRPGEVTGDGPREGSLLMTGRTGRSGKGRTFGCGELWNALGRWRLVLDEDRRDDEYIRLGVEEQDGC